MLDIIVKALKLILCDSIIIDFTPPPHTYKKPASDVLYYPEVYQDACKDGKEDLHRAQEDEMEEHVAIENQIFFKGRDDCLPEYSKDLESKMEKTCSQIRRFVHIVFIDEFLFPFIL